MFLATAHPVFAWIGVAAVLFFVLGLMWKAMKTAVFFIVMAVVAWVVFFAG